ncbi:MAG: efflux RND transporter permease subunit [Calditrichota bacterium]
MGMLFLSPLVVRLAAVEIWGADPKLIRIEFYLDRLKAYNINVSNLMQELRGANFTLAGGSVRDGGKELMVRSDGRIQSLEELRRLPLGKPGLYLCDIAEISYSSPDPQWIQRIDRNPAIQIGVYKESGVNTIALSERANKVIEAISNNPKLAGLKINVLFDQGVYIKESLRNLQESGMCGGGEFSRCWCFFSFCAGCV